MEVEECYIKLEESEALVDRLISENDALQEALDNVKEDFRNSEEEAMKWQDKYETLILNLENAMR